MAEIVPMPDLGFEADEGELSVWLKGVGDAVQAGEPIAEFESDKVTLEVESPVAGVLLEHLIQPGESVAEGAPIARIGEADELSASPVPAPSPAKEPAPPPAPEPPKARTPSTPLPTAPQEVEPAGRVPVAPADNGLLATPIALRMAREHNLDLRRVAGSGPGGRILRGDVENHLAEARPGAIEEVVQLPPEDGDRPSSVGTAASPLRRTIARRMSQSKQTIPHFYITSSVTMDDALALRRQYNEAFPADAQVTVNDIVVKAVALALRDFPNLNASYIDDRIEVHTDINVGAAVAVEGGVLTVTTRQTDRSPISDIARENRAMIERARAGRARPDDVAGSTFTISNLGGYDTDHFAAIINPPQAAILAVATARETAVVEEGQLAVRTVMQMTISADHRVTDGAECALFLQRVKELLESPIRLFLGG
ncbi:MAG: 2-oxo acid dehydrogenase subunit E2 [Caldilineaceae bacterium SB0661_bin_32]|uniref:Dihydrolipoamide acetyltransferase component of pyruvate dehydrogenase complex n=1 Tax=Caldilineaceae bacterium SB0661_bin_32 TaxID=2605255 RepID=A0A6B1DAD6_9CHLR|nr:2-oxo acid dehydrogenase subunit E2 [Caldilineaceae bacterium SB0661_bin_32]